MFNSHPKRANDDLFVDRDLNGPRLGCLENIVPSGDRNVENGRYQCGCSVWFGLSGCRYPLRHICDWRRRDRAFALRVDQAAARGAVKRLKKIEAQGEEGNWSAFARMVERLDGVLDNSRRTQRPFSNAQAVTACFRFQLPWTF